MEKKLVGNIVLFFVFLLIMFFHVLNIQTKNYMSMSEFFSISASNALDLFDKNYNKEFKGVYSGEELRKNFLIGNANDMLKDIKTLYFNHIDPTHSNLYYSALRISLFNLKSVNLDYLIFRGTVLNLLCLIISFFFMYKLLSQIYNDKIFVSFALFIAFSSRGLFTNISRVREYSLQMMFVIIFTYLLFKIYKKIKDNTFSFNYKSAISFSLITALTILSGYLTLIYITLSYLFLAFLKSEKKKDILKYLYVSILITIFFVFLICPHFALGFWVTNNELWMFHSFTKSILRVCAMCNELIFYTRFYVFQFICILLFILLIKKIYDIKNNKVPDNKQNDAFIFAIFLISCTYLLFLAILNPHLSEEIRRQYTLMVMPFLSLLIPYICVRLKYKKCLIFVFCIMFFISAMKMCRLIRFMKSDFNFASVKKENSIDSIIKNKQRKVQIISDKSYWYESYLIMNFDKNRNYIVNPSKLDTKNSYVVLLSDNYDKSFLKNFNILFSQPVNKIYIYESKD